MFLLNEENCSRLKHLCYRTWPNKKVKYKFDEGGNNDTYFFLTTDLPDSDNIHYEYNTEENRVEFHIEGDVHDHENIVNILHEDLKDNDIYQWQSWQNIDKRRYVLLKNCENKDDIINGLKEIIALIDPIIKKYSNLSETSKPEVTRAKNNLGSSSQVPPDIKAIAQLEWDQLEIPPYQRPYKWTVKNVNQLISDIHHFQLGKISSYRIGTLVLHNYNGKYEIVDGQQRIVTISLLLSYFFDNEEFRDSKLAKNNQDVCESIKSFCNRISFDNKYSVYNIIENWNTIVTRKDDLTVEFFDFLLNKCEMVEVRLNNISEAFQFFDSQNSRGKDLEPHDLLKAYHLREIDSERISKEDDDNLRLWQDTQEMRELFKLLYQSKEWSLCNSAWDFTKDDIDEFKGISLKNDRAQRFPFYQLEVIAHVYIEYYRNSPDRIVDGVKLEYPYNLDDQIINGSRFFDLIRHYKNLKDKIFDRHTYDKWENAKKIMDLLLSDGKYDGGYRTGDTYVQSLFMTSLFYYVDRFGFNNELNKIVPQLFLWAFSCRLSNKSVRWLTVDNYARGVNNRNNRAFAMLSKIHQSHVPEDILNISIDAVENNCSKCEQIKKIFTKYKKLI